MIDQPIRNADGELSTAQIVHGLHSMAATFERFELTPLVLPVDATRFVFDDDPVNNPRDAAELLASWKGQARDLEIVAEQLPAGTGQYRRWSQSHDNTIHYIAELAFGEGTVRYRIYHIARSETTEDTTNE